MDSRNKACEEIEEEMSDRIIDRVVKDSFGGFTEFYTDGSKFVLNVTQETVCNAYFIPAQPSIGWRFWKKHWHSLRIVTAWSKSDYKECTTCDYRAVTQRVGGYSPIDRGWVKTGLWSPTPPIPKSKSGLSKE